MNATYVVGSMADLIAKGQYYHVSVLRYGWDVGAASPEEAALKVGCLAKLYGYKLGAIADCVKVAKHWAGSRIGATITEACGEFQTLTSDHYDI